MNAGHDMSNTVRNIACDGSFSNQICALALVTRTRDISVRIFCNTSRYIPTYVTVQVCRISSGNTMPAIGRLCGSDVRASGLRWGRGTTRPRSRDGGRGDEVERKRKYLYWGDWWRKDSVSTLHLVSITCLLCASSQFYRKSRDIYSKVYISLTCHCVSHSFSNLNACKL